MEVILLFGVSLVACLVVARAFEKLGIPQVVAYIVVGIIMGESFLKLYDKCNLDAMVPLTNFALALIGYMVGSELKHSVFKRYGRQFFTILLSEGLMAMAFVCALAWLLTGSLALGLLLGALSSATAPAATVDVLWQYRSRGPLTTTVLAIVALDDGLALILYGFALAVSEVLIRGGPISLQTLALKPAVEIGGSILLGGLTGAVIDLTTRYITSKEGQLVMNLGGLMIASALGSLFNLSLILTSMSVGLFLTNIHPHRNERAFEIIRSFSPPVYILFFVLLGARLQVALLPKMGLLGLLYVIGRTAGKWMGSYLGATVSGAPEVVKNYLGFALFSQAGVAVGLALDIYQRFQALGAAQLGNTVINIITATTFVVQIIGPPSVKFAITKAKEVNRE
ncbi:MAG: hypothetical protein D6778_10980 [Nitrospirae bacterium]|nr:MAG: hypothetical protein D6778_10980 [Nitrospirota bacterium]